MLLRKQDIHMEKNDIRHIAYKNQLNMGQRLIICKPPNYKATLKYFA